MRQYGYLVVEGPHDIDFCARLLSTYQLRRVQLLSDLDPELRELVPRSFPHGGDLLKRVPVPLFLQNEQHVIAIHSAIGDSRLVQTLEETLSTMDHTLFSGLGLMLDADDSQTAGQRFQRLCTALKALDALKKLALPEQAGKVCEGPPRLGIFVLPDNISQGTLENLLLESATTQYPDLLPAAERYVDDALQKALIPKTHRDEINKPAGRNKAVIGAMAALFKPGKAIQTSIQDHDWVRGKALSIPRMHAVQKFLEVLFKLPAGEAAPD